MLRRSAPLLAVPLAAALLLVGCTSPEEPVAAPTSRSATPTATPAPPSTPMTAAVDAPASTTIATAKGSSVAVSDTAGGATTTTVDNPLASGAPLVFRVLGQDGDHLQVALAQRPNGSTGWIRASDVTLVETSYALVVDTTTNELTLYDGGEPQQTFSAATGTGGTPTPTGSFYLTELLAPTNEGYGPYAYGLSAFSDVLNSFGGGPGQIGLHGTNDASSIGTAASHGCIRLHDDDITTLAEMLPLGTPIQVR